MEQKKQRNYTLDCLRLVAAFLIVGLHIQYKSSALVNGVNLAISRVGVPFFFLLSGYFCDSNDFSEGERRAKKGMLHAFKLSLIGFLLYFVYLLSLYDFKFSRLTELPEFPWGIDVFVRLLLCNDFSGFFMMVSHLWFLPALAYGYAVLWLLNRLNIGKNRFWLTLLLIPTLFFGEFSHYFGIEIENYYYRNFLLTGLPFLLLGGLLHQNAEKLTKINDVMLFLFAIGGCAYSILMQWAFMPNGIADANAELYLGSVVTCIAVFILAIKHPNAPKWLSELGKEDVLWIYILHMMVNSILTRIVGKGIALLGWYQLICPIVVFVLSLGLAELIRLVKITLHKRRRKA